MRRTFLAVLVLLAMGCSPAVTPPAGDGGPRRLLVAGTVDLRGPAATVAQTDPESLFREVRLVARRADVAIVAAASVEAGGLLAAAGFDAVACPFPQSLTAGGSAKPEEMRLRCSGRPGLGTASFPAGARVTVEGRLPPFSLRRADIVVALSGEAPAGEVIRPPLGRTRLAVSGLGALLSVDGATRGALLEALVDAEGVIAYRLGRTTQLDARVRFPGWDLPAGDAVLLDGEWWALVRPVALAPLVRPPAGADFARGDLTAAALGDVTGDGRLDLAASYRHPFRPSALSEAYPGAVGVDLRGRSAHLGIFTPEGEALWAAGYLPRPVGDLAACDGAVALAYTGLDDPAVVATGAAVWQGFGLRPAPELPGPGAPGCADVDGDGRLDPVILSRQA